MPFALTNTFHIYGNGGTGGPVDLTTLLATVTGTTWTTPALSVSTDWTFLVRSVNVATGLEERNLVATYRIILDASGNNITNLPTAPTGLTLRAGAGGTVNATWRYDASLAGGVPTQFQVFIGTPTPTVTVAATVIYYPSIRAYSTNLSGLVGGTVYEVLVKAVNATGSDQGNALASVTGSTAGPIAADPVSSAAV